MIICISTSYILLYPYSISYNKCWLVVSTPLKNISQMGLLFPIYGKYEMFQTTNQIVNNMNPKQAPWTADLPSARSSLDSWTGTPTLAEHPDVLADCKQ